MGKYVQKVADLVQRARRNGTAKGGSYYAEFRNGLRLYHYGTMILDTSNGIRMGGYSTSDRDAIETALSVLGHSVNVSRSQKAYREHKKGKGNYTMSGDWLYR